MLKAFGIAGHAARQVVGEPHVERKVLGLGYVAEITLDVLSQPVKGDLLDLNGDGARLDLGKVQDVIDEVEKIGARRVDVAREFDLTVRKVAGDVLGELLT